MVSRIVGRKKKIIFPSLSTVDIAFLISLWKFEVEREVIGWGGGGGLTT
jgi:hypothetical protein